MIQPSYNKGAWCVVCDGQEIDRFPTQGVAIAYASAMALTAVFERRIRLIQVKGKKGVVWSFPELSEALGGLGNAI